MPENDWRAALVRRYPQFFRTAEGEPTGGYPTVGNGWRDIVETAVARIADAVAGCGGTLHIVQIKEKFGGIRIYRHESGLPAELTLRVSEIVELAEARADCTCETCGAQGRLHCDDGWYVTCCGRHARGHPVATKPGRRLYSIRTLENGEPVTGRRIYDREHDRFLPAPEDEDS